jgi:flagellar biosynthesis/type III secretory pathway protein FliH
MKNHFDFFINQETIEKKKISDFEKEKKVHIQAYAFAELKETKKLNPEDIINQKKSAFHVNSLVKNALQLEEIEKKRLTPFIEEEVKKKLDALYAEEKQKGFEEGLLLGSKQAQEESSEKIKDYEDRFKKWVEQCESLSYQILAANETFFINLIIKISSRILHHQISLDKDFLKRSLYEMLNHIDLKEGIKVTLSKKDETMITYLKEDLLKDFHELKNITMHFSEDAPAGSIVIENKLSQLDMKIDENIERIHQTLLSHISYE